MFTLRVATPSLAPCQPVVGLVALCWSDIRILHKCCGYFVPADSYFCTINGIKYGIIIDN